MKDNKLKYIMNIHAYDCLDQIQASARVDAYEDYEQDDHSTVLRVAGTFRGTGEDDPSRWLVDILSWLIESL